jgi:hypothetical protein
LVEEIVLLKVDIDLICDVSQLGLGFQLTFLFCFPGDFRCILYSIISNSLNGGLQTGNQVTSNAASSRWDGVDEL